MSTKISIAETTEWELFQRMWDKDLVHIRAEMRVGDGSGECDDTAPRDVEIILPKKWLRELVAGMDEHDRKETEANAIARDILAKRGGA